MDEKNVISLTEAKAKAAGVSPELIEVIDQLNTRFDIRIDIHDERLERFKLLYSALNEAATQGHHFQVENENVEIQNAFLRGVDVGRAQMMTDVIICILEQDGLISRSEQ